MNVYSPPPRGVSSQGLAAASRGAAQRPAATSDAAEMQYLRRLARAIVGRLLPRSEVQLAALRLLIEELLAVTLLKPLLANLATAQTNRALYVVASLIFKTCEIHTH